MMQVGLKPIVQEWGKDVYKATLKKKSLEKWNLERFIFVQTFL